MKQIIFLALVLVLPLSSCALLEEFEITYGGGQNELNPVKLRVRFPEVGDTAVFAAAEGLIFGTPDALAPRHATLAHLRGAMRLAGECTLRETARRENVEGQVDPDGTTVSVHDCDPRRCPELCPAEVSHGLLVDLRVQALVVSERRSASIRKTLVSISPSAIRQFRLQLNRVEPYETVPNGMDEPIEVSTVDRLAGFSLSVAGVVGEAYPLLGWNALREIAPETPQRYDLPMDSDVVAGTVSHLLRGEAIWLVLRLRLWYPEPELYEVLLAKSGILVDLQPELVLSVREVAGSVL